MRGQIARGYDNFIIKLQKLGGVVADRPFSRIAYRLFPQEIPMPTYCPKVSVVTVFFNRAGFFEPSINSLLRQSYRNIEIVIVDDGSQDDTRQKMLAIDDSRVLCLSHSNLGLQGP